MEQHCDCTAGDGNLNGHRDVMRLRTVEAKFSVTYGKPVSITGDTGDRHRRLTPRLIPMELSLVALASRALHRCSCPCGVLHCLRSDCGLRAIAHNLA